MDRIIYTTMTGANAAAHRQAVLSHNLANASTPGFRAEMSTFRSVPLQGDGASTRVFALEATSGYVNTPGPVQRTGRNLDAMAAGNAWFAVQGLDGTEAYTRAGSFEVSATGQLLTPTGLPVLSDGGAPIDVPPGADVSLGSDGTVTSKIPGQPVVGTATDGSFGSLRSGALEDSNVDLTAELVNMMTAQRAYQANAQTIKTQDQVMSTLVNLR